MFRPVLTSRRVMLAAMKGIVLSSPPLPPAAAGAGYCATPGRDILAPLEETAGFQCGECKWHAMRCARRAIDDGAHHVELCMTVSDDSEEHVFCRVDGQFKDDAVKNGMPVRQIGDFIAETVWRV